MELCRFGRGFLFTGISGLITLRKFNKERGELTFWKAIRKPSVFTVLLSDLGDMLGLIIAFAGVFFHELLHNRYYDGVASIAIGVILIAISTVLALKSKSLLMGETISSKTIRKIISLAESDRSVHKVRKHFSMYMAPEEVVLQLVTTFRQDMTTKEITESIQRITKTIQKEFPRIKLIFIEPV